MNYKYYIQHIPQVKKVIQYSQSATYFAISINLVQEFIGEI